MKNLFKFSFIVLGLAAFTACNSAETTETEATETVETVEIAPSEEEVVVVDSTAMPVAPADSVVAE